jgi:hypothetical protein
MLSRNKTSKQQLKQPHQRQADNPEVPLYMTFVVRPNMKHYKEKNKEKNEQTTQHNLINL